MENSFKVVTKILLFLFLSVGYVNAQEKTKEENLTQATRSQWKKFEDKVTSHLGGTSKSARQVYLKFTVDGSQVTIIADNLIRNGSKLQIVDAKASSKKNLATASSLYSVCTRNQRKVYPAVNKKSGKISKVEVRGGTGLGNVGIAVGQNIKNLLYTASKKGVVFYVTKPAGNYNGTPYKRYLYK